MRDNCAMCLLGAMDRLWFHQIILFPQPISLLFPRTLKTSPEGPEPISETLTCLSSNISQPPLLEEEISSAESPIIPSEDDSKNQHDDAKKEIKPKEGPTRLNLITSKSRSRSSSPLNQIHLKRLRSYSGAVRRLQKTMSCKSLPELELEEVKGFMDLGFKFSKENLSPRMIRVLPGLQRLADGDEVAKDNQEMVEEEDEEEEEEEERGVMRPYLSEAWLIKRPDSPLLNLRLPRVSTAAEMKKHLRFWARTVASVIQQES